MIPALALALLLTGADDVLRGDGIALRPLTVPATGNGCDGPWSFMVLGSEKHEGTTDFIRFRSQCFGYKEEAIRIYRRDGWLCMGHQGAPDAWCVAGPGAMFPNGNVAPTGALWLPGAVYVGNGDLQSPTPAFGPPPPDRKLEFAERSGWLTVEGYLSPSPPNTAFAVSTNGAALPDGRYVPPGSAQLPRECFYVESHAVCFKDGPPGGPCSTGDHVFNTGDRSNFTGWRCVDNAWYGY